MVRKYRGTRKSLLRDENDVNLRLEKVMQRSFNDVLKTHIDCRADMRHAANMPGVSRVADAAGAATV